MRINFALIAPEKHTISINMRLVW